MCGISGIVQNDGNRVSARLLDKMTRVLAHRGPDNHSTKILGKAGLGHRRLAIVDLSPAGHQPMCDDTETIWIVCNGEIYNHLELRQQLERQGFKFRSHNDTEVILYLYRLYGDDCVQHLRGMFAFAIWDIKKQRLMMARDRFGQKSLFYSDINGQFMFASELKSLKQNPALPTEINPSVLHRFISMDYIAAPDSIFKAVRKLPAAHQLVMEAGQVSIKRYWQLDYSQKMASTSLADRETELAELFDESVRLRLMGEVPVGVYLSGGIDSNSIAAAACRVSGQQVKTFSLGFNEKSADESQQARVAAEFLGTKHREIILQPDLENLLPVIARHMDEPFGDPSAVPTWCLSEMASQHITVALSGEGGDEALAGYSRYRKHQIAHRLWALPKTVRQGLAALLKKLLPASVALDHPLRGLADLLASGEQSLDKLYSRWLLHCDAALARDLYTHGFQQAISIQDPVSFLADLFASSNANGAINSMLDVDQKSYLGNDLLPKLDMCMMAHSMEGRSPFLDHKLAAFMAALPEGDKLHAGEGKWILRRALAGQVAPGVMKREKRGFGLPLNAWLGGPLYDMLHDTLLSQSAQTRCLFRASTLTKLIDFTRVGHPTHCFLLWNLLMLELWFQGQEINASTAFP
jgi:asparagine synthase (glutamine-hydrolysing)